MARTESPIETLGSNEPSAVAIIAPPRGGLLIGRCITKRFTLEDCADDVAAVLAELGTGASIVAGYSMGGPIAQLLWQRHPDAVAGLVLCATSDVFCDSARDRVLFAAATGAAVVTRSRSSRFAVQLLGDTVARHRLSANSLVGQVLSHDWGQVLEAGRSVRRFDCRAWLRKCRCARGDGDDPR